MQFRKETTPRGLVQANDKTKPNTKEILMGKEERGASSLRERASKLALRRCSRPAQTFDAPGQGLQGLPRYTNRAKGYTYRLETEPATEGKWLCACCKNDPQHKAQERTDHLHPSWVLCCLPYPSSTMVIDHPGGAKLAPSHRRTIHDYAALSAFERPPPFIT